MCTPQNYAQGNPDATPLAQSRPNTASNPLYGLRAFDYQITTQKGLSDNPYSLSECEIILEALSYHSTRLYDDLCEMTGADLQQDEGQLSKARNRTSHAFESGELAGLINQLYQVTQCMSVLGGITATALHEIYSANPNPADK